MRRLVGIGVVVVMVAACSSGGAAVVGAACSNGSQCASLSSGYCANAGVCSRPCSMHSDCGCAPNTTNGDIAQGACQAACTNFGGALGAVCTRVCANNASCEGATTCNPATGNGMNLGYSVCD
ncbi:MAG TPA: hypothetical protein VLM85_15420 [Polyangiaceae bacterium]|nr:hypothetical protein [Polyangiaceae bacterium]